MEVMVTQFMCPDGRRIAQVVKLPNGLEPQYQALRDCGCRLTAEKLMDGTVSQCVEHDEGDFDIQLTKGDNLDIHINALAAMVARFDRKEFCCWLKNIQE